MNNFEKQLSTSSKRIASAQMAGVAPVAKPSTHTRISAAWYTTPAAAVVGLLVGLFLQFSSPQHGGATPTVAMVYDTIVEHVYDTIHVEIVSPVLSAESKPSTPSRHSSVASSTKKKETDGGLPASAGRCMNEDGIDYSKLVSCIY